jgi:putative nucleotidyltransferase with HDIG domain
MTDTGSLELTKQIKKIKSLIRDLEKKVSNPEAKLKRRTTHNELILISNYFADLGTAISYLLEERDNLLTLAEIGGTINSSLATNDILQIVIDTIILLTGAERCFLMLKDKSGELQMQIGRNWRHESLTPHDQTISSTIANRVITDGVPVLTTNAQEDPRFDKESSIIDYKLRSIMCVPLEVMDTIIGVIYADNRLIPEQFTESKLKLLDGFANQAAIALQNANLFENLQHSHKDLQGAYNSTLEGWAKALELRDNDTEGHTRRVTRMTTKLARLMNINDDKELENIRRGAILHDIGKMAIPDEILHKRESLTNEEWDVMRQHPNLAKEMLTGIDFLSPALDIPQFHHEKWDGSGYPNKLKGEKIPLAARIFAIVDVWDAMTCDRPYRKALFEEEVIEYISDQDGKHFDPEIVKVFLNNLNEIKKLMY